MHNPTVWEQKFATCSSWWNITSLLVTNMLSTLGLHWFQHTYTTHFSQVMATCRRLLLLQYFKESIWCTFILWIKFAYYDKNVWVSLMHPIKETVSWNCKLIVSVHCSLNNYLISTIINKEKGQIRETEQLRSQAKIIVIVSQWLQPCNIIAPTLYNCEYQLYQNILQIVPLFHRISIIPLSYNHCNLCGFLCFTLWLPVINSYRGKWTQVDKNCL